MALTKINIGDTGAQAKAKIDAAMDNVDSNTADILTLQGNIPTLQSQIDTINNTDIPNIQNDLSAAQSDISDNQADIASLQGDMTTAQGDITSLQTTVTNIANDTADAVAGVENVYNYEELDNAPNVTLTFAENTNKRYLKKINSAQNITISVTDTTVNGTIEVCVMDGSVTLAQSGAIEESGFGRTINAVAVLKFVLMEGYLTYSYTSYETSTTPDLTLYHSRLSVVGNAVTFAPSYPREYVDVEVNDNTALTLDIQNNNEHYILVHNTTLSPVTIAVAGSNGETIIGNAAISVTEYCEIGVVKHSGNYVVTSITLQ